MTQILLVGAGGFVGSIARYLIAVFAQSASNGPFPLGTLIVNVVGCIAIGSISQLLEGTPFLSHNGRAFLVIGLLGGFTTFSTFGNETVTLLRDASAVTALLNVAGNVFLAIGGVWLGRSAVSYLT